MGNPRNQFRDFGRYLARQRAREEARARKRRSTNSRATPAPAPVTVSDADVERAIKGLDFTYPESRENMRKILEAYEAARVGTCDHRRSCSVIDGVFTCQRCGGKILPPTDKAREEMK